MDTSSFSIVFLAGGTGTRMKSETPKQYLTIHDKLLALHSFEVLLKMSEAQDCIVVCEPQYESIFQNSANQFQKSIQFARPGPRRQDSVYNGLQKLQEDILVCIHDSARPMIEPAVIRRAVQSARDYGACAIGVKVKSTMKICNEKQEVIHTPDRNTLWEIQTPQIIQFHLLQEGFMHANQKQLTVTDDVSLIELLNKRVVIIEGAYSNIKITTPEDWLIAEKMIPHFTAYALL